MRRARTFATRGLLHGALLYGVPVALIHVVANHVGSQRDAGIMLAGCVLLYGAASAAIFLVAGLAIPGVLARRASTENRVRRAVGAGVFAVAWLFWFRYFHMALTYDELPFAALRSRAGMLAWVAARALMLALVAAALARPVATWLLAPLRSGIGRALALLVTTLAAAHLVLPWYFARAAAHADAAREALPRPGSLKARATGLDVVLVGFDGADWRVAEPLIAAGALPVLARLMQQGAHAPLATLPGANSSTIWASIDTGQPPASHGILDFARIRLPGMGRGLFAVGGTYFDNFASDLEPWGLATRQTVHRQSLTAIPLWEVLDATSISFGLVDAFFYSYPAFTPRHRDSFILGHGAAAQYQRLRGLGHEADAAALAAWVQPVSLLASAIPYLAQPEVEWQLEVTLALLRIRHRPRFFHVYVDEPDQVQHRYWKWYQPEYFLVVDPADLARKQNRIPDTYRRLDAFLGELLALVDRDTVVIVCSDHGHSPTILHPTFTSHHNHGPPGILLMAGGPIVPEASLRDPHVLDLFPTVLHLLGLPVPEDAPGRVLTEALTPEFLAQTPITRVQSYAGLERRPAAGLGSAAQSAAEIERLRALGYIQ